MEKFDKFLPGTMQLCGIDFPVEIINDSLVVKMNGLLSKEHKKAILSHVVSVRLKEKRSSVLYLYIDKIISGYFFAKVFHILLSYEEFEGTNNVCFEIISKGLIPAVNVKRKIGKDQLYDIKHNLGKKFLNAVTSFDGNEYDCCFENIALINNESLCSANFSTALLLKPKDGSYCDKIFSVFNFAIQLIQFVSLNTYPVIDHFIVRNDQDGYSEVKIYQSFEEYSFKNDRHLNISLFGRYINRFINCFPDIVPYRRNVFHYKAEWINEFDIVRMTGMLEWVFKNYVEKSKKYQNILKKKKKEIHYDELSNLIDIFSKKYKLKGNADFDSCKQMFYVYGGTLKAKLEYVISDFCNSMGFIIIDNSYYYSPALFETRLKNARNVICHGLYEKEIDWYSASCDTKILQELIYFMLLKYKAKLPSAKIKNCLRTSFQDINTESSLYKKNDPRIKWDD